MEGQELLRAALRGLHLAALMSAFGTLLFALAVAPAGLRQGLTRFAAASALTAVGFGVGWFLSQAIAIAGGPEPAAVLAVASETRFGQILMLRLLLLGSALISMRHHGIIALALLTLALGLQSLIGHAGASDSVWVLAPAEALHLLAGGAWLGALGPLWFTLKVLPPRDGRMACEHFSPIGLAAVLLIAGTAVVQAVPLVGSLPGLIGTGYGQAALGKLALFMIMLGLAAWNRLSLTDRLDADGDGRTRRTMMVSVGVEAGLGLLVALTAGLLASQTPAAHSNIDWPFRWRPDFAVLAEDDLRREVAVALMACGAAVALLAVSIVLRRGRLLALPIAAALAAWQAPNLSLLLVEAYPTSYRASPTGFAAAAIVQGQALFAVHCAACHGDRGQGDGAAAAGSRIRPADLTAAHLWDHSDGELFWWITDGMRGPDGVPSMPGFATVLNEASRWALIDAIRAENAGLAMRTGDAWPNPVPAPNLPLICSGLQADTLVDLRGQFVRVIAGSASANSPDVVTVGLDRTAGSVPPNGQCQAASGDAWVAYAALAGIGSERLSGAELLIDANGWLRALRRPGQPPDWNDPTTLAATVRRLRDQPITAALGGLHVHGQ